MQEPGSGGLNDRRMKDIILGQPGQENIYEGDRRRARRIGTVKITFRYGIIAMSATDRARTHRRAGTVAERGVVMGHLRERGEEDEDRKEESQCTPHHYNCKTFPRAALIY